MVDIVFHEKHKAKAPQSTNTHTHARVDTKLETSFSYYFTLCTAWYSLPWITFPFITYIPG